MTATLWTKKSVCAATGGTGNGDWSATGVSIDSRTIEAGDLFIALRGPHTDGHEHVSQALANGAVAALIDHHPNGLEESGKVITVSNTMTALNQLAKASRNRSSAKIIWREQGLSPGPSVPLSRTFDLVSSRALNTVSEGLLRLAH